MSVENHDWVCAGCGAPVPGGCDCPTGVAVRRTGGIPEGRWKEDCLPFSQSGWAELVQEAVEEAWRAMRRFPQPNYVITKFAEEAGEVVKAAVHAAEGRDTAAHLRDEMRQAVAMLYRLWVEGDRVHGLAPVNTALAAEAQVPA